MYGRPPKKAYLINWVEGILEASGLTTVYKDPPSSGPPWVHTYIYICTRTFAIYHFYLFGIESQRLEDNSKVV